jgi:hypothetical protein
MFRSFSSSVFDGFQEGKKGEVFPEKSAVFKKNLENG